MNAAVLLETELAPLDLLDGLLTIEKTMGRDRSSTVAKGAESGRPGPAALRGNSYADSNAHALPHPAMWERRFVLEPLAEIAPGMVDPITERTVEEVLYDLESQIRLDLVWPPR